MRLFFVTMLLSLTMSFAQAKEQKQIILTKDNTLVLNQAFTGKSISYLIGEAKKMDADLESGYPIYLFLDTPGGYIYAGLELIEFLRGLNRPVHTVTLFAASMGWQLLQHLGDRYVLQYSVLMSHKAAGGFSGEFGGGSSQIDSRYGLWLRKVDIMDKQTVKRTNGKKTLKQYRSEYDNELWLNGQEAVDNGYADEVVTIRCDKGLDGTVDRDINFFGFKIKLSFDKCPIRTYPVDVQVNIRTNYGYMSLDKFMSNGGKFGKKCRDKMLPPQTDYYGKPIGKARPAELCLMDKTLTLEKINSEVEKAKKKVTDKNKNILKMSFGQFISEK